MTAENANASQVLLSHQAKKTYVLMSEDRLRETALLLKQVDELKDHINTTSLASRACYISESILTPLDMSSARERIGTLEQQGFALAERAKTLYTQLEELSLNYSNVVRLRTQLNNLLPFRWDWCVHFCPM